MMNTYNAAPDIEVLSEDFPIPGYGQIPVNAFVIKGAEPILVDTGAMVHSAEFISALECVIDPAELKWIWLTHPDLDHIGSLHRLLAVNPKLKVVTTYLGAGIMTLIDPLPLDRVHLVNPGGKLTLSDRTLTAVKPPAFDNACTTGFFDDKSQVFFSSDCFGALLSSVPQNAAEISDKDLLEGQTLWATIDAPWLHRVDTGLFAAALDSVRKMQPKMILSNHLPPAPGHMTERLLASLAAAPAAQPFVGPDQAALEQMLAGMTAAPE